MALLFTDEQEQIRQQARAYLSDSFSPDGLRALLNQAGACDERFWQGCKDMGWTGIAIPEAYGGLGLSALDLCIIAEECGRFASGAPFLAASYAVADALERWGPETSKQDILPLIASGDACGAVALLDPHGALMGSDSSLQLKGGCVSGSLSAVTGGALATHILTLAADATGRLQLVAIGGANIERRALQTFDNSRCAADIIVRSAPAIVLPVTDARDAALSVLARLAIVTAFEQIGGAEAAMFRARDYALERQAFGQPIGRFQAIKHRIAEMYVAIELARGASLRAALSLMQNSAGLISDAASARLTATEAFEFATREAMQTHGGIGVTWEHDLHLFYRRSRSLALEAGSSLLWEDTLIDTLQGSPA